MRSWGDELWDGFDKVDSKFVNRIKNNENVIKFIKDKSGLDLEYAKNLKALVARNRKLKSATENTADESYMGWLEEVENVANQYEMIVESVQKTCTQRLQGHTNEMVKHKNTSRAEYKNYTKILDNLDKNQEKAKQNWDRKIKEYEKAKAMFDKADSDIHVTKADVEKARIASHTKRQQAEDAKNEYSRCLVAFNEQQRDHYTKHIPELLNDTQSLTKGNGDCFQEILRNYCLAEKSFRPLISKCIDDMESRGNTIDSVQDCNMVVETVKTGYSRPEEKPFEDMENPSKDILSTKKTRKIGFGLFSKAESKPVQEDMSHLPPQQRKRQLLKMKKSLLEEMDKDNKEVSSLTKMMAVDKFGNGEQVRQKITEANQRLEVKKHKISQISQWLNETAGELGGTPEGMITDQYPTRLKPDERAPPPQHSPKPVSTRSVRDSFEEDDGQYAECLFPFQEVGEGCISINAGEHLNVTEMDNGDGWTKVKVQGSAREGFVPTTYIKFS